MQLNSVNVRLYPSAFRGNNFNPEAKLNTEENITSLVSRLSSRDGFVLSNTWVSSTGGIANSNTFIFSLHGYIFEISNLASTLDSFSTNTSIYAHIRVGSMNSGNPDTGNTGYSAVVLTGIDEGASTDPGSNQYAPGDVLDIAPDESYTFIGLELIDSLEGISTSSEDFYLLLLSRASTSDVWSVPTSSSIKFDLVDISGGQLGTNEELSLASQLITEFVKAKSTVITNLTDEEITSIPSGKPLQSIIFNNNSNTYAEVTNTDNTIILQQYSSGKWNNASIASTPVPNAISKGYFYQNPDTKILTLYYFDEE